MDDLKKIIFKSTIKKLGINPFVFLPENVLAKLFKQAGKSKGKIPVIITIDGHEFTQTLIKYQGQWRLYINGLMRKAAQKDVNDTALFSIVYDPKPRVAKPHPKLIKAFNDNPGTQDIFKKLSVSRQQEINRYLAFLKTEKSIDKNVKKTIDSLLTKLNPNSY